MEQPISIPPYTRLLWPTLQAVLAAGGSSRVSEIVEKVVELEGLTEEQQRVPHGTGTRSEVEYRLAWSRTNLKGMGLLRSPLRGVWEVTEGGRRVDRAGLQRLHSEYTTRLRKKRHQRPRPRQRRGQVSPQPWRG
jgi:restriction system protein